MKNWILLIGLAAFVGGCATQPAERVYISEQPTTVGAPAPEVEVVTATESSDPLVRVPVGNVPERIILQMDPQMPPHVWGYEFPIMQRYLVSQPTYPWSGPIWTGTFMPDYLDGRRFPWH